MASAVSLLIFVLALWVQPSLQWRGNSCSYKALHYETRRGHCTASLLVVEVLWPCVCNRTSLYLAKGSAVPGGQTTKETKTATYPSVTPCSSGGTCRYPGRCNCRPGYTGATCTGLACNNERPCYPGACQPNGGNVVCNCMRDFSDDYCKHLDENQTPEVTQMTAQFSYWAYDGDTERSSDL
ncbi:delta-like protein 4 [Haliotis rubra]|uniref:delta-like protein 4 n=1 Tax=Haliotis rubra TaxID=36100 RepID=UPI001EE5D51B|nr:delta-like protein 4 [Haliotis rubra]